MIKLKNTTLFQKIFATAFLTLACSCTTSNEIDETAASNTDVNTKNHSLYGRIINNIETDTLVKKYVTGTKKIIPYHYLKMSLDTISKMYYFSELFNTSYGGNYTVNYKDQGGSGMDGYPNITIGSSKFGGNYIVADPNTVGMPVKISQIPSTLSFDFQTSQQNANDSNDKWMASINFIFDNYGSKTEDVVDANRDYDLVVMHQAKNFNDSLDDNPLTSQTNGAYWYFARNTDGSLKPYNLTIDGITYSYAVRYKFFYYPPGDPNENKNDKTHVKFIPYGSAGLPPVLKVNIKNIIQISKDYINYANLSTDLKNLANANVALPNAWLKSINAGYEVYTGESLLNIDKFKMNL